jgi:shikimate dehydrogenase
MTAELRLGPVVVPAGGSTPARVYVLIGDPVAHSLSPRMQNAAFRACGLDAVYVACAVPGAALPAFFADLRRTPRIGGANVTVPHKQAVLPWLDRLDSTAALAGAVNTIRVVATPAGVELHGHNTDSGGLVQALSEHGVGLARARVIIVGAGGMARAAVIAAFHAGALEVRVCNRDPLHAQDLLDTLSAAWTGRLPALACGGLETAPAWLADADVLVHATPLGLHATDPSVLDLGTAQPDLFVYDTVYSTATTSLVRAATVRGLRAVDGRALLLHQGAAAFTLWTGVEAPLDAMRSALGI